MLEGYGHYEVYAEPAFGEVMRATVTWFTEHLPPAGDPRSDQTTSPGRQACD